MDETPATEPVLVVADAPSGPKGLATPSTIGAAALLTLAILAALLYASC